MSFIKSNYGLGKKKTNSSSPVSSNKKVNVADLEAELLRHVGGSFVYVKSKKFFVEAE